MLSANQSATLVKMMRFHMHDMQAYPNAACKNDNDLAVAFCHGGGASIGPIHLDQGRSLVSNAPHHSLLKQPPQPRITIPSACGHAASMALVAQTIESLLTARIVNLQSIQANG